MKNKEFFTDYIKVFLEENSKLNLISKNEEKFLWEKHIYDSLAIEFFFEKYGRDFKTLLDFGTGGGFPSVPIALAYPEIKVTALDSIRKKIVAVEDMKQRLKISNLETICDRVENLHTKFDLVTSRAVASLDKIVEYAIPHLKRGGYFITYKSRKTEEEIKTAKKILNKYKAEIVDILEYALPLEENYTRNLIIIRQK